MNACGKFHLLLGFAYYCRAFPSSLSLLVGRHSRGLIIRYNPSALDSSNAHVVLYAIFIPCPSGSFLSACFSMGV